MLNKISRNLAIFFILFFVFWGTKKLIGAFVIPPIINHQNNKLVFIESKRCEELTFFGSSKPEVSVGFYFTKPAQGNKLIRHSLCLEKKQGILCLENGCVFDDNGYVLDSSHSFLYETLQCLVRSQNVETKLIDHINGADKFRLKGSALILAGPWSLNYYHWMLDTLPKLKELEKFHLKYDYICVPGNQCNFQKETLKMLNLPMDKLIFLKGDVLQFDKVYVPKSSIYTSECLDNFFYHPNKKNINFVKNLFKKTYFDVPDFPKKIYISRKKSGIRNIINHNQIKEHLNSIGFTEVFAEELSLSEQATLFHNAEFIVGLHGAGLANVIHCKPGTKIIEIFPQDAFDLEFPKQREFHIFPSLCKCLDLEHYFLCGTGHEHKHRPYQWHIFNEVYVNVNDLENLLASIDETDRVST